MMRRLLFVATSVGFLMAVSHAGVLAVRAQDPVDATKGVEADAFGRKRQKKFASSTVPRTNNPSAKKRYYRPVGNPPRSGGKASGATAGTEVADIGFTLWKFTNATEADDPKGPREANPKTKVPMIARRAESERLLDIGDIVRLGVESGSHPGHLYVVHREKYKNGTFGKPTLIFPTLSAGMGRNYVQPGVLLYFPSAQDFFEIASDTAVKQVAEELTVIVSPTELIDPMRLQAGMLELSDAEVNGWINKWEVPVAKNELVDGAGSTMTAPEKEAGDQQKSLKLVPSLSPLDAPPQTLYRMRVKRGAPVLARIELKIKSD